MQNDVFRDIINTKDPPRKWLIDTRVAPLEGYWETMVFRMRRKPDVMNPAYTKHYYSREEAEAGHRWACDNIDAIVKEKCK